MRSVKDIGARMMGWIIPTVEAQASRAYDEFRCTSCGGFSSKPQKRACTGSGLGKVCSPWISTGKCGDC